jgi:hypothetical protein
MQIDNDHEQYVVAYLGDLGRDLPFSEQVYWRSFNIPPSGPMSEVAIRRGRLGQFADARSIDHRLKSAYVKTNKTWLEAFGWSLFKPPHKDDEHLLKQLRIPLNDSQAEFDGQVLVLAKLLVDSLNGKELEQVVGQGPSDEHGLGKLDRFLAIKRPTAQQAIVQPLRSIQGLRSTGGAHLKGTRFDAARSKAPADRRAWMAELMEQALLSLTLLAELAA